MTVLLFWVLFVFGLVVVLVLWNVCANDNGAVASGTSKQQKSAKTF